LFLIFVVNVDSAPDFLRALRRKMGKALNNDSHQPQTSVILNLQSRRGEEWYPHVEPELKKRGVRMDSFSALRDPVHLENAVEEALARGDGRVIVGGGDGTFSAVAPQLARPAVELGVLPTGTGNQFARDLGIAPQLDHAADVIAQNRVAEVDVGVVNGHPFLNVASLGLTTQLVESLTVVGKRRWGRLVYVPAFLRAWRKTKPLKVRWQTAELDETFEAMQVVLGNGRFHVGRAPLAPEAHLDDGKLDIYALEGHSRWRFIRYLAHIQRGLHGQLGFVRTLEAAQGTLTTDRPEKVVVDGEIVTSTPLEFEVWVSALRVLVPAEVPGTRPSSSNPPSPIEVRDLLEDPKADPG